MQTNRSILSISKSFIFTLSNTKNSPETQQTFNPNFNTRSFDPHQQRSEQHLPGDVREHRHRWHDSTLATGDRAARPTGGLHRDHKEGDQTSPGTQMNLALPHAHALTHIKLS